MLNICTEYVVVFVSVVLSLKSKCVFNSNHFLELMTLKVDDEFHK